MDSNFDNSVSSDVNLGNDPLLEVQPQDSSAIQEPQVDPAYADYFTAIPVQNFTYPQQYQQPVYQQQPAYQQQPVYAQQGYNQQVQQVVNPADDILSLSQEALLEKFDSNPAEVLKAVIESARRQAVEQMQTEIAPQIKNVRADIEFAQTQKEVTNTVQSNLQKNGVVLNPAQESAIFNELANTGQLDNAWSMYNAQFNNAILTGQPLPANLHNNGNRLSEKDFAINYATNYAIGRSKSFQAQRIKSQPQYQGQQIRQTVNTVAGGGFSPQPVANQQVDLRTLNEEQLAIYAKQNGLSY